jgi:hypothetical protein
MNLTAALGIVAALVLLAIVLQGHYATRRARPERADARSSLLRHEPGLDSAHPDDDAHHTLHPAATHRTLGLDEHIDVIAPLTLENPVAGALIGHYLPEPEPGRAGTKPMAVEGLAVGDGDWHAPVAGRFYAELRAGIQLVDRHGPIGEIEYSGFVQTVQALADGIGATADLPDMRDVVERASRLDAFASQHDAQLAVVLRTRSAAWTARYVEQHAARQGFRNGGRPDRMVLNSGEDGAPPMLVLTLNFARPPSETAGVIATVRDVTLSFDVMQTAASDEPFAAWHKAAKDLADDMDADIVDDKGLAITPIAYATIAQDLQTLYAKLEAEGLAAGSALARRLFS